MLVNDARQAIKEEAPLDRMRALTSELQQVAQSLGTSAGPQPGPGPGPGPGAAGSDEDVIDAEFTE
jgi:molecular chaperone DnaK